ncbi:MAG: MBL fold metallo-hydrolase [Alphaproteobacteria bacterium]|nr:MBL fold metallo-hydrolase [Alphaproteobacteria bacterium]
MKIEVIPVTPFAQNCSLIWDQATGEGALVDPGGDLERLMERVAHHEVRLTKILLTHGHLDHCAGAPVLARQLGLPIEGPQRAESFWLDQLPAQAARWGFPPSEAFVPDRWLEHGERVAAAGVEFEVVHCPGHTPGHIVFFQPDLRLALVGDVLFRGSIGRTDFPRGDHAQLIASIMERLLPLGDDVTFVPGHGPLSTFGQERETNPFLNA